jgi:HCOMODA/2-hydroxy-3-carboxy-muconic semialdehyde decarboxylase
LTRPPGPPRLPPSPSRTPSEHAPDGEENPVAAPVDPKLIEDLEAANRILADQGVFDAFGHVSVRHDRDAGRYLMSRSLAPALVMAADIMEYDLESVPAEPRGRSLYLERFIHGEIYKARPDVGAIVITTRRRSFPSG